MQIKRVKIRCPVCSAKFMANSIISYTVMNCRLDFKPEGGVWQPFSCPSCRFVFFNNRLNKKDLVKIKKYLATVEFKKEVKTRPLYIRLAKFYEMLNEDPFLIGDAYLKASWDYEMIQCFRRDKYESFLQTALHFFFKYLKVDRANCDRWLKTQVLCVEIQRILGRFIEAKLLVSDLKSYAELKDKNLKKRINFEIGLIDKKDSSHHYFDEIK